MPNLEEFDRKGASGQPRPIVSIQKSGDLTLNEAAYEVLKRPTWVKLLYGAKERVIGFRPSHENSQRAYAVKQKKPNGSYTVAGVAFLKAYEVAHDRRKRYPAEMEDGDLLFYLDRDDKKPTQGV